MNHHVYDIIKVVKPRHLAKYFTAGIVVASLLFVIDLAYDQPIFIESEPQKVSEGDPTFYDNTVTKE